MRAGRLRHWVTIQNPEKTRNQVGEPVTIWTELATVPAAVEPVSSKEQFAAKQFLPEITHRIKIRYLSGVSHKSRIVFNGRIFELDPPRNADERNRELEIMAKETPE